MTILCTIQMLGFGAESTDLSIQVRHILNGPGVFGAHNSRWNSDNPITHDHDQRCDGLSCGGYRMNIAKTYGGEGYDTPVDGNGDIAEAVFGAFHHTVPMMMQIMRTVKRNTKTLTLLFLTALQSLLDSPI